MDPRLRRRLTPGRLRAPAGLRRGRELNGLVVRPGTPLKTPRGPDLGVWLCSPGAVDRRGELNARGRTNTIKVRWGAEGNLPGTP